MVANKQVDQYMNGDSKDENNHDLKSRAINARNAVMKSKSMVSPAAKANTEIEKKKDTDLKTSKSDAF